MRELSNMVEKIYVTSMTDVLTFYPGSNPMAPHFNSPGSSSAVSSAIDISRPLKETIRNYEEQYIRSVLDACGGKVSLAAERLQITKAGLYKKLDSFKKT